MRILIVEDSPLLAEGIAKTFRAKGYAVDHVETGEDGDSALQTGTYDLVILDLGLPDLDGLDVLRRMRSRRSRVPVLVLTARDSVQQRVEGLNLGADDYVGKPFSLEELEARAGALIRRGTGGASAVLNHGALALDTVARIATIGGKPLDLPRRELTTLEVLLVRRGQIVSKDALLDRLTGFDDEEVSPNAVETYIHRLRKKLEPAGIHIRTLRGLGYLLEDR